MPTKRTKKPVIFKLPVPANVYDATLAWCNAWRVIAEAKPWTTLPPGRPGDPHECPCAMAHPALHVGEDEWSLSQLSSKIQSLDLGMQREFDLPMLVQDMVLLIDEAHERHHDKEFDLVQPVRAKAKRARR